MPGTGRKIRAAFRNFGDKIRTSVSIKKHQVIGIIALITIVFLGILIRLSPIFRAPITFKEFDVWAQYNNVVYLLNNGLDAYYHYHSYQFWYPEGKDMWLIRPGLTFTAAFSYLFLQFIGINVSVYEVCYYLPAVFGGLSILFIYLLGKEVLDSRTGLLAAFFLAFNPGHLQRSTAGFFDNEAVGVFAAILFFYFFTKALKTGTFKHALGAGLASAYLSLSWGAAQYPLLLVPLIGFVLILAKRFDDKVYLSIMITSGISLISIALQPVYVQNMPALISQMEFLIPLVSMFAFFIVHWFNKQEATHPRFYESVWKVIKVGAIPVIVIGAIILWVNPDILPFDFVGRAASILDPFLRASEAVTSSVGEHMPSAWSVFYYNTMIPIFMIPVGIFFSLKRLQHADFVMIAAIITLYYFTGSMVRIIMLFAPIAALVGAYGLSSVLNYFGNIGRKKIIISRRRKRQTKHTMGPEDTAFVFIFVGAIMIAQVVQTTNIAIDQMSYSELIVGGTYQDWPESLTWMRTNLGSSTVVVSWWDYGYWCSVIGNVTTVNDNGTDNATRMGLTGMAMMQTDELESARCFRALHADYVLVYFGFLVSGLGGDEGKWPWMVRICNEWTDKYDAMGLRVTSGNGAWKEDTVFDYEEYYNSTSNAYEDKWFESQLVKMMFYGEPTAYSDASDSLGAYFAAQVAGTDDQTARTTDNGATWASMIPSHGYYDFSCFTPAFFSSNRLVKIFKLDYSALDSDAVVTAPVVYTNGYGSVNVSNTGPNTLSIQNLTLNTESDAGTRLSLSDLAFETSTGSGDISPGENLTLWFNASQSLFKERGARVTVGFQGTGELGQTFTYNSQSPQSTVKVMPKAQIFIDRSLSTWIPTENNQNTINVTVRNVGSVPTLVTTISLNDDAMLPEKLSGSGLILPNATGVFGLDTGTAATPLTPGEITVNTAEGASDTVLLTNATEGYKISILPIDYTIIAEGRAQTTLPTSRKYVPVTLGQTTAWGNSTIEISVKNTGTYTVGLQHVYLQKGDFDSSMPAVAFDTTAGDGDYFLSPGETKTIITSLPDDLAPNDEVAAYITVIGTGTSGSTVAADGGILQVIDTQPQLLIMAEDSLYGRIANANETVRYILKNVGNSSVDVSSVSLNGTVFSMSQGTFTKFYANGTSYNSTANTTLGIQEVGEFNVDVGTKASLRLNLSTICNLGATNGLTAIANATVYAKPYPYPYAYYTSFTIQSDTSKTNCSATTGRVNVTIVNLNYNVTLNALIVNGTSYDISDSDVTYPSPSNVTLLPSETKVFSIYIGAEFSLADGNILSLKLITKEGWEYSWTLEVDDA